MHGLGCVHYPCKVDQNVLRPYPCWDVDCAMGKSFLQEGYLVCVYCGGFCDTAIGPCEGTCMSIPGWPCGHLKVITSIHNIQLPLVVTS